MGLEDRDALAALRDALHRPDSGDLIARFFTTWFAIDPSVPDMFGPELPAHRAVFAQVMDWLLGEFVAQRSHEPVAFLAQLGRDHRQYGVTADHYDSFGRALFVTLSGGLGQRWTPAVAVAARAAINLVAGVMKGAAEAESGPPWWTGTVVEHHRVSPDVAVVRLYLDTPMDYLPGQYVHVEVPQMPRRRRYLSPAIPAQPDGGIEFHVRAVPGGVVSPAIVDRTRPGDRWRMSGPYGGMQVDRNGADILMVAGSTGLAPFRAIIMDLARFGPNPRLHLFFGARYPSQLYGLRTLWEVASHSPWLTVTPVSELADDPPGAVGYPDAQPPGGLHIRQTGRLPEVVTRYGGWSDRQILICGGPGMVPATRAALIAKGAPPQRIQHDPPP